MGFWCRDLDDAGVTLIPSDSRLFLPLLSDVKQHLESRPYGSPPPLQHANNPSPPMDPAEPASAILWNRSGKFICAWTLIWKYWDVAGREFENSYVLGVGSRPSLLLPFGLAEERRKFFEYWHTIMPGSKRYLCGERMMGTNADVRPPDPSEYWKGGVFGFTNGRSRYLDEPLRSAMLTLDAVFFSNGECAGPDTKQLWEHIVSDAGVHQEVGMVAKEKLASGADASSVLAAVEEITGGANSAPPPPPPPDGTADPEHFRQRARWHIGRWISMTRPQRSDEETVSALASWADAVVPNYRRI